jgi:hypothetical protein
MPDALPHGVFVRPNLLPPLEFARVLAALERLSGSWARSEDLGLLGRNHTRQVRGGDIAAQGPLDEIRAIVAPAALAANRAAGFAFPRPPHLQLFPVLMDGNPQSPPRQEPHVDSSPTQPAPPICANVFYARARGVEGGALALARERASGDLAEPVRVTPQPNTLVSFIGDWVHWVEPLTAGERLSIVVNFY